MKMVSRGLAIGDYDNDGDLDGFVLNIDQPSMLIRNNGGNRGNWLMLELTGTKSNKDGLGAKVTVSAGGLVQSDEKKAGTSYLSQANPRMQFGLGQATKVDEVTIRWPSGIEQKLKDVRINQSLKVVEPRD